jgi:hypothetical protein
MFSGQFDLREHQGATFIDRDPTHFRYLFERNNFINSILYRILLNYLRTNTFIEPKSTQDRAELLLEAEYYQITSLVKQLKCEAPTNTIVVEKLVFDPNLHHPQVVISENGLKANYPGTCAQYLYAKVQNMWQNGQHYWEIILDTKAGNISII